ncbi:unnamed protein product, partial [Symbiodinium necroappetens]
MDVFSLLRRGLSGDVCESLSFAPLREVAPLVHSFTGSLPEVLLQSCRAEKLEAGVEEIHLLSTHFWTLVGVWSVDLVRLAQLLAARFLNECLQLQRASSEMRFALEEATEQPGRTETTAPQLQSLELPRLRARCKELERELEERRERSPRSGADGTLDEAEALRAALGGASPGAAQCSRCQALEAKLREQEERLLERQLEPASGRVKEAAPADPALARLLVGEAPPVVRRRAAVVLQSAWRRRAAVLRFERHLVGLVFPARNDGRKLSGTVGSVRLAQALAARVFRALRRRGLDFEAAFRCADTGYEDGDEHPSGRIRVGQFLLFLCRQPGLALAPAESAALLRLLKRRDRGNRKASEEKAPPSAEASDSSGLGRGALERASLLRPEASTDLQEAWRWEMPYDFARQLQAAASRDVGPAPACEALEAVAELLRGRRCRFLWGSDAASWDRLVRDALLLQLLEERERLQAAIEDRAATGKSGTAAGAAAAFLSGELECQLADCESDMKAALQGPSPPVSATAFTARLLREQLPLAPVTLHAASRAALEGAGGGIRQGQVLDNLRQQQELKGNLVGGFVRFQQPLSASPSLIHITATRPAWTLRLKELSERGMLVQISPLSPAGWKEDLQLAYCAGSAEGVQHIGPSKGIRTVQVHFIPRLTRTPELVALQTYIRQRQGAPSGPAPARPEPEAVLCQLGGFAIAASLPGDGDGLSLRAVRTGKVVEETSAQATLGRGKVALALAAPTAVGELEIKAQWEPTAETETKEAKAHEGEKPEVGDFLSMSRVKVARASLRGFAVLLHRDAQMLQLWYEAVCSDATTSARALQALATLPEAEKDEEAQRSKGLQALSLELPEPEMPWSPETPARSRGDGFTGFTTSQSGLSLPDSEGMSSQQMAGEDIHGQRRSPRPLMVVEQPMAARRRRTPRGDDRPFGLDGERPKRRSLESHPPDLLFAGKGRTWVPSAERLPVKSVEGAKKKGKAPQAAAATGWEAYGGEGTGNGSFSLKSAHDFSMAISTQHKTIMTTVPGYLRSQVKSADAAPLEAQLEGKARSAPSKRSTRSLQGIKPDADEVLQCIESLYVDKLKPFGRILRKRVAERHVQIHLKEQHPFMPGAATELPDVDIKHLKALCDDSDQLDIAPEEGGDWSATFRGRAQVFVDIYSPEDDYSPETWQAAREYFASLPESEALLPGGRYSCAQALVQRELPFLGGFTLGEVCHLVQLAISKHKILGYCNGAVVPYSRSQSRVKEECAESQQPCIGAPNKEDPSSLSSLALASLEKAREHLREILRDASSAPSNSGPSMVPLSNVKRLFRSRYQIELSETALGHSKLSELLQDQRFSDICEVQLQGQGYIVVQVQGKPEAADADTEALVPSRYNGGPIGPVRDDPESQ